MTVLLKIIELSRGSKSWQLLSPVTQQEGPSPGGCQVLVFVITCSQLVINKYNKAYFSFNIYYYYQLLLINSQYVDLYTYGTDNSKW